jgi:hypothetical protein
MNDPYSSASLWSGMTQQPNNYNYQLTIPETGNSLIPSSSYSPTQNTPLVTGGSDLAKGAAVSMIGGGTLGQTLTGAGIYGLMGDSKLMGAGGAALGGGLALSMYEQSQKANAMNEQSRVDEAQKRKAAVQNALNSALQATSQLGIMS